MLFIVKMAARMIKMLRSGVRVRDVPWSSANRRFCFTADFLFPTAHVISSLPLDRGLDKWENGWYIIRREWIVTLWSRHKMLTANPRVVGWGPIFSADCCYPPLSSLWFSQKMMELMRLPFENRLVHPTAQHDLPIYLATQNGDTHDFDVIVTSNV